VLIDGVEGFGKVHGRGRYSRYSLKPERRSVPLLDLKQQGEGAYQREP
jgi:hypothetical protein